MATKKKSKNKWIQKAVKHPGEFSNWCENQGFSGPTAECVAKAKSTAKKTKNKHLMGMANFAARAKGGF